MAMQQEPKKLEMPTRPTGKIPSTVPPFWGTGNPTDFQSIMFLHQISTTGLMGTWEVGSIHLRPLVHISSHNSGPLPRHSFEHGKSARCFQVKLEVSWWWLSGRKGQGIHGRLRASSQNGNPVGISSLSLKVLWPSPFLGKNNPCFDIWGILQRRFWLANHGSL